MTPARTHEKFSSTPAFAARISMATLLWSRADARRFRSGGIFLAPVLYLACLLAPTPASGQVFLRSVSSHQVESNKACRQGLTALVLSGGGARGLAHTGVIKALDQIGFRPDILVGTSMGAIIGSLYASGFSGSEIEEFVRGFPLQDVFPGYDPALPAPLDGLPVLATTRQRPGGTISIHAPLAQPALADSLLIKALSGDGGVLGPDFESLPIPFFVVATDLETMEPVTLSEGDLVQAIMASFAIPVLLPPIEIEGRTLVDGGISSNIPIEIAREHGAIRVIVSDATSRREEGALDYHSQLAVVQALLENMFIQSPPEMGEGDLWIRHDLGAYSKTDFTQKNKRSIIQYGFENGEAALEEAVCLPTASDRWRAEARRSGARNATIETSGSGPNGGHGSAAEALVSGPARPNPAKATDPYAWRSIGIGGNYDHELGASAWMGTVQQGMFGDRAVGSLLLVAGHQTTGLELAFRGTNQVSEGAWPLLSLTARREQIREFDARGKELDGRKIWSFSATLGPEIRFRNRWTARGGIRVDGWNRHEKSGIQSSFGGNVHVERSAHTNSNIRIDAVWTTTYARIAAAGKWPVEVGTGRIAPEIRVGFGRDLPAQMTLPLGGTRGFPGLHIGEARGNREAFLRLNACHPLVGPVRVRVEMASGMTGESVLGAQYAGWIHGARVGIGMDTFFGPIDLEHGWATTGQSAWYLRIGRSLW